MPKMVVLQQADRLPLPVVDRVGEGRLANFALQLLPDVAIDCGRLAEVLLALEPLPETAQANKAQTPRALAGTYQLVVLLLVAQTNSADGLFRLRHAGLIDAILESLKLSAQCLTALHGFASALGTHNRMH